jgi:hypothetical protein
VFNAVDAMPAAGTSLHGVHETAGDHASRPVIRASSGSTLAPAVELTVTDTGINDRRGRIFDPFFTTAPTDRARPVRGVWHHGAPRRRIDDSAPGQGTASAPVPTALRTPRRPSRAPRRPWPPGASSQDDDARSAYRPISSGEYRRLRGRQRRGTRLPRSPRLIGTTTSECPRSVGDGRAVKASRPTCPSSSSRAGATTRERRPRQASA